MSRRPDEVLPQHKRRAVALWTVLIGSIILCEGIVFFARLNTSFAHGGEYEQTIPGVGMLTPEDGWCVEFETSTISQFLGQERNASYYLDYLLLDVSMRKTLGDMYWYPGGTESDSNTCVVEGWEPHSEWMYVKLKDPGYPESGLVSTGIQVPYSCITNVSSSHSFTYVGIGVTIEERLGEEPVATNKALSVSTATHRDKVNAAIDKPYAQLSLQFQQEPNSLEVITENDPFDLAEMFGNVGGFWDLLMLVWPIFFVAASRQDPHLKPRNFKKSVAKGLQGLRVGEVVTPWTRKDGSINPEDEEVKPHWERKGRQDVVELDHPTSKKSVHRAPV
ncbi:unnamed protein product [Ectocarpus sp. CCAP 1310/34]|nr:unnamed protein product [Ectocarpus sp. CCAP 1310/34]